MNIENLRREFEAIPEINEVISGLSFFEDRNLYGFYGPENNQIHCSWLNGAWWQFQQMNKKLEGCVVVPVEPTPKMIDSTWDDQEEIETMSHNSRNEFIYKKMIEVAMVEAARGGNE